MRVERREDVTLTLVTDDYINFRVGKCKTPRFAYYDKQLLKNYDSLEVAIRNNIKVDLIIERISKGKVYDYVKWVSPVLTEEN